MRKFLVLGFLFLFFAQPILADKKSSPPSLSDAVYADLAIRHYLDNVSIYYTDGKNTHDIKLNETRHWIPASTVKTFAAMYAYKLIAEGKLYPYDLITIESKNSVPEELVTDELPNLIEGDSVTLSRLIRQMITQSDNTSFNVLLDVLGRENITKYIQSLGLIRSHVGSKLNLDTSQEQDEFDVAGYGVNTTTAEDYAKAFLFIYKKKIPGAKNLLAILRDQKINNMIPLLLPKEVICAHKTGDLNPLYHDGGICQDKKQSYVLTIFTNAGDPNLLAHLSELIYTKNFDLVGESLDKKPLGLINQDHPLDPLVLSPPKSSILGASTTEHFPIPSITAADLGVTAQDLSLVIKAHDLPNLIIPADSALHVLSDAWQIVKKAVVLDPKARRDVDLETARLRLAEAKDLIKKGDAKGASVILQNMQIELKNLTKDPTIARDSASQNAIQAVSETRFAILADGLKQAKGEEKVALIKDIANQAKDTLQNIQPNIPDATNATNPSQKPLIGEVINTTPTEVTVKTSGGQQVTIPINNNPVAIKDKKATPANSSAPSVIQQSPPISPSHSTVPSLSSLAKGATVALIGSTTNNTFSPTLVLINIPKELAAPQPVTVVKVDTKHNTMVVVENGVYTQVNINKNTTIKGADTSIPLKEIKPGDLVVVRGEPLTPIIPTNIKSSPAQAPIVSIAPTSGVHTTPKSPSNTLPSKPATNSSPIPSSIKTQTTSTPQNQTVQTYPTAPSRQTVSTQTQPTQPQPKVIQGQSIHFIEKKENTTKVPPQPKSEQETREAPHEQPKSQPQALPSSQPTINKSDEKKK